jgi:hypothetical protein
MHRIPHSCALETGSGVQACARIRHIPSTAADKATVVREAAQDRLRVLLAQAEIVRSLGASVRQAYELAGATGLGVLSKSRISSSLPQTAMIHHANDYLRA